jgi:hypothetical protein
MFRRTDINITRNYTILTITKSYHVTFNIIRAYEIEAKILQKNIMILQKSQVIKIYLYEGFLKLVNMLYNMQISFVDVKRSMLLYCCPLLGIINGLY